MRFSFLWNMLLMKFLMHTQPFSIFHFSIFSSSFFEKYNFYLKIDEKVFFSFKISSHNPHNIQKKNVVRWRFYRSNPRRISNASSLLWLFLCVKNHSAVPLFTFFFFLCSLEYEMWKQNWREKLWVREVKISSK